MRVAPRLQRIWFAAAWFLDETSGEFTLVGGGLPYKSPYGGEYQTVYELDPKRRKRPPIQLPNQ